MPRSLLENSPGEDPLFISPGSHAAPTEPDTSDEMYTSPNTGRHQDQLSSTSSRSPFQREQQLFIQSQNSRRSRLQSAPSSQQHAERRKITSADSKDVSTTHKRFHRKKALENIYNVEANIKKKRVPSAARLRRKRSANNLKKNHTADPAAGSLPRIEHQRRTRSAGPSKKRQRLRSRPASKQERRSKSPDVQRDTLVLHPSEKSEQSPSQQHHTKTRAAHATPSRSSSRSENRAHSPSPAGYEHSNSQPHQYLAPNQLVVPSSSPSVASRRKSTRSSFSNASTRSATISPIKQKNEASQKKNQLDFLEKNLDLKKRQESQLELAIKIQKRQLQLLRRRLKIHQEKEEKAKAAMGRFESMGGPENVFLKLEEANRLLDSKEKRLQSLASDLEKVQKMTEEKQDYLVKLENNLKEDIRQVQGRVKRLKDIEKDFKKKQRDSNVQQMKLKSLEDQLKYKQKLNEEKRREVLALEENLERANRMNEEKKRKLKSLESNLLDEKKQVESRQRRLEKDTLEFHTEQEENQAKQEKQWKVIKDMQQELDQREKGIVNLLEIDDRDIHMYGGSPKAIEEKLKKMKDTADRAEHLFKKRSNLVSQGQQSEMSDLDIKNIAEDSFESDKASAQRELFSPRGDDSVLHSPRQHQRPPDMKSQPVQTDLVRILTDLRGNQIEQEKLEESLRNLERADSSTVGTQEPSTSVAIPVPKSDNEQHPAYQTAKQDQKVEMKIPSVSNLKQIQQQLHDTWHQYTNEIEAISENHLDLKADPELIKSVQESQEILERDHSQYLNDMKSVVKDLESNPSKSKSSERLMKIRHLHNRLDNVCTTHKDRMSKLKETLEPNTGSETIKKQFKKEEMLSNQMHDLRDQLSDMIDGFDVEGTATGTERTSKDGYKHTIPASRDETHDPVKGTKNAEKGQQTLTNKTEKSAQIKTPEQNAHGSAQVLSTQKETEIQNQSSNDTVREGNPPEAQNAESFAELQQQLQEQASQNDTAHQTMKEELLQERKDFDDQLTRLREEYRQLKLQFHMKVSEVEDEARKTLRDKLEKSKESLRIREQDLEKRYQSDMHDKENEIESLKESMQKLRQDFDDQKLRANQEKIEALKQARDTFDNEVKPELDKAGKHISEDIEEASKSSSNRKDGKTMDDLQEQQEALQQKQKELKDKHDEDIQRKIEEFEHKQIEFQRIQEEKLVEMSAKLETKNSELVQLKDNFSKEQEQLKANAEEELQKKTKAIDEEWEHFRKQQNDSIHESEKNFNEERNKLLEEREKFKRSNDKAKQELLEKKSNDLEEIQQMEKEFQKNFEEKLSADPSKKETLASERSEFQSKMLRMQQEIERHNDEKLQKILSHLSIFESDFEKKNLSLQNQFEERLSKLEHERIQKRNEYEDAENQIEKQYHDKLRELSSREDEFKNDIAEKSSELNQEKAELEQKHNQVQEEHESQLKQKISELEQQLNQKSQPVVTSSNSTSQTRGNAKSASSSTSASSTDRLHENEKATSSSSSTKELENDQSQNAEQQAEASNPSSIPDEWYGTLSREELVEKMNQMRADYEDELKMLKKTHTEKSMMEELIRIREKERQLRDELDRKNQLLKESRKNFEKAHQSIDDSARQKYHNTIEDMEKQKEDFRMSHAEAQKELEHKIERMKQQQSHMKEQYEERLNELKTALKSDKDGQQLVDLQEKLMKEQEEAQNLRDQIEELELSQRQISKDREQLIEQKEHYMQLKKDLDGKLLIVQNISANLNNLSPSGERSKDLHNQLMELQKERTEKDEELDQKKRDMRSQLDEKKSSFEREKAQEEKLAENELNITKDSLKQLREEFEEKHERMKQDLHNEYQQQIEELTNEKNRLKELENSLDQEETNPSMDKRRNDSLSDNQLRKKLDRLSEDLYRMRDELNIKEEKLLDEEHRLDKRSSRQNEMMNRFESKMRDDQEELNERLQDVELREEELELRYSRLTARINDAQTDPENNHKPIRRLTFSDLTASATTTSRSEKRIVYVSKLISHSDCENILKQSQKFNKGEGITGVLICSSTAFLQVIEGSTREVDTLYRRIVRDRRHHDIHCIRVEDDIPSRIYHIAMRMIKTSNLSFNDTQSVRSISPTKFGQSIRSSNQFSSFTSKASHGEENEETQALLSLLDIFSMTYRTIEKYVPPLVVNMSKSQTDPLMLPIAQHNRIIMIVDVLRFAIRPRSEDVKSVMAKYFSITRRCVTKYGGEVLQYTGNSVIAVFEEDQAHFAVKASMLLFKTILSKMPLDPRTRDSPIMQLGVALTEGEVLEGSFGCGAQMSYHVVGEHMQRAWQMSSRLAELNFYLAFDKSIGASLKRQQSAYSSQVKHIGTVHINTVDRPSVELYSLSKKQILLNPHPIRHDDGLRISPKSERFSTGTL